MQKFFCLLILFSLFFSLTTCTSGSASVTREPAEGEEPFFNAIPTGNGLVFIGVTGRRSDPKETVQFALEDAARRVAAYQQVYGEYAVSNNVGSGAFDYAYDTHLFLNYDIEGSKQYVDALKFNADIDTLEIDNSLIIRTTYPVSLPFPVNYRPVYSRSNQKPNWVDNPPLDIAGYEVGVGFSGRYSSLADTCTNAFHNAVFAIIRNVHSSFRSSSLLYQNTGSLFGYKTSDDNISYSYGMLNGFYILDMWINPKDKSVWTLAIAKKSEP